MRKRTSIMLDEEDLLFMKEKGYNLSRFTRYFINKVKKGKINYED